MVKLFNNQSDKLLAGTDNFVTGFPGLSLHEELEQLDKQDLFGMKYYTFTQPI